MHPEYDDDTVAERTERSLPAMIRAARIPASLEVIRMPEGVSVQEVITDRFRDADVVFLGLRPVAADEAGSYVDRLHQLMSGLGNVMLVRSAGPFRGQLLGVEHGDSPLA